jgi:hypothetical protein
VVGRPEGNRPSACTAWIKDNIKRLLKGTGRDAVEWIHFISKFRSVAAVVNTVMNASVAWSLL